MKTTLRIGLIALVVVIFVSGCGKPPEQEMQAARSAIETAKSAEAELYAREAYAIAQDTLNAAIAAKGQQDGKFTLFRSYGKARNLYLRAQALAEEATAAANTQKERYREEVAMLMDQAQRHLASADSALAKAPVGKGSKADIELIKGDLAAAKTTFEDARRENETGRYLTAKAKLEMVIQRTQAISNEIAAASRKKSSK
jgi:hypothetical protein